jgi:hypothetical protein
VNTDNASLSVSSEDLRQVVAKRLPTISLLNGPEICRASFQVSSFATDLSFLSIKRRLGRSSSLCATIPASEASRKAKTLVLYSKKVVNMCHGHPRYHPCNHISLSWFFCPVATVDLKHGTSDPCENPFLAPSQHVSTECPLKNCNFRSKGGTWTCCESGQGPNSKGWCTMSRNAQIWGHEGQKTEYITTCDHGCCDSCRSIGECASAIYLTVRHPLMHPDQGPPTQQSSESQSESIELSSTPRASRSDGGSESPGGYIGSDYGEMLYTSRSDNLDRSSLVNHGQGSKMIKLGKTKANKKGPKWSH